VVRDDRRARWECPGIGGGSSDAVVSVGVLDDGRWRVGGLGFGADAVVYGEQAAGIVTVLYLCEAGVVVSPE
jgi:hypothetical protein